MANTLILNQPFVLQGVQEWTYTVPTSGDGIYSVHCESTEVPPSGVGFTINVGGSPVYESPTLSATQGAVQFQHQMLLAAADVVTVVMASAVDADSALNKTKTTCTIQLGA